MMGLLFFMNFILIQAHTRESNDKLYKILRDSSTLQKTNSFTSKSEQNKHEDTTKVDVLSVLHDIGSSKQLDDTKRKVLKEEDNFNKEDVSKIKRTSELTWLADLLDSSKDIKVKELVEDVNVTKNNDLKDVLLKLVKVLEELNRNIFDFNDRERGNGYMMMKLPLKKYKSRIKRDTDNSTDLVLNELTTNETAIANNTGNFSSSESGSIKSGRRNMNTETLSEVKEKLLAYLNESFSELKIKVEPLNGLKLAFGNNNDYKIGYVIAHIDTLEANLNKLEKDMEINKHNWDDNTILQVFEKLKVSNSVVTSLLESLGAFVKSKPH